MLVEELGNILQERRKVLGITQKHLSEISGVHLNTIAKIEQGKVNPTLEIIHQLAEVLGLELTLNVKRPK